MSKTENTVRQRSSWRSYVAAAVWVGIAVAVFSLFTLTGQLFGMAVGVALHAEVTAAEQLPLFWGFVAVAAGMSLAVVAAIVARRWVALVLALILAAGSGVVAAGLYSNVRSEIAPIEHTEPDRLPCQCYSGGDCDCPGG